MLVNEFLLLGAVLFCIGVYGVIARKNAVMVLMSIELILNSVNINLLAFSQLHNNLDGNVFALYIIAVAAAEVGVGLAMVLLIYIGAVMILFLFGVMLTRARVGRETDLNNKSWALGIPVALLMLGIMCYVLIKGFGDDHLEPTGQVSTAALSDEIFKPFLLPFEALSFVLLAAVIGAIVLARKD